MLLASAAACGRHAPAGSADAASAREFVQSFLDQYLATARTSGPHPAFWRLLGSEALDPTLAAALREDSAYGDMSSANGTREGLNFDPFLASQDPCPRYEAVSPRASEKGFRVRLDPVCVDASRQTQGPVVEVSRSGASWRVVNVFYQHADLRTLLCEYARGDRKGRRAPAACAK